MSKKMTPEEFERAEEQRQQDFLDDLDTHRDAPLSNAFGMLGAAFIPCGCGGNRWCPACRGAGWLEVV